MKCHKDVPRHACRVGRVLVTIGIGVLAVSMTFADVPATPVRPTASAGVREAFVAGGFRERCALLAGEAVPRFKALDGLSSSGGDVAVESAAMLRADIRALSYLKTARDGMRVYGFSDSSPASGTHTRELVLKVGGRLAAEDAEVWDPRQGTFERPFVDGKGLVRLLMRPRETLFLVWTGEKTALPMRMDEIAGREVLARVESRSVCVDGGAALAGASWIWHPDSRTAKGVVTLRTSFELPEGAKVQSARLSFSADNGCVVFLNGKRIGSQKCTLKSWMKLSVATDLAGSLRTGENQLVIHGENLLEGDAGVIASLDMTVDGRPMRVFTDERTWTASLDGKTFKRAWAAGVYGDRPWMRFDRSGRANQRPLDSVTATEISFFTGRTKPAGRLFLVCDGFEAEDGKAKLEVNGMALGELSAGYRTMDVTRKITAGANKVLLTGGKPVRPRLVWTAPAKGPYDLRCEYLSEALGVVKPRFFWKYAGEKPSAFRLNVATAPERLPRGDVYSGETAEHLYVEPELALEPFTRYWWRVEGGGASDEGTFVTGIGKWRMPFFKPGWKHHPEQYWVARRRVELKDAKSVTLSLVTLGSHKLYVNGKPASEGFGPNRSHIEDGILLATTYDVTDLVKDGANDIDIYVTDGWAAMPRCRENESCLSVDGRAVTEGGVVEITSEEPWQVAKSRNRARGKVGRHGNWGRQIERLCDVETFSNVQKGIVRKGEPFSISCDVSEKDRALREIRPLSITPDGKYWKIDMGEQFTGFMRLKLKGKKGTVARMTASDTFVDRCNFSQISEFEFAGGDGVFENILNWQSGRFFYLTGCERPSLDDVTGIVISSIGRRTGDFVGDKDLEIIKDLDNNTMIATTQCGVTVDCPHRERLGYGEASLSSMWGNMPFFDSAAYFYAYQLKWASSQRPDGSVPHVSPDGYGWGGTFWSSFPVFALTEYSRLYPDARLNDVMRPVIDKWLDYLHGHVKNGVLVQYEPKKGDCLGDWLYPEIHKTKNTRGDWGHTAEGKFFNNCSYAWALKRALETEGLVRDPARRAELARRHAALAAAIDREWYKDGQYVSEDARYQAIAIVSGVAEAGGHLAETEKAMLDIVEWKGYVDGGSPSYTVILRVLCASRRGRELALRAFRRREPPSFLFFADEGYSTIPEDWWYGRDSRGSMIHTCYTGPAGALMHGFAGFDVRGRNVTVAPLLSDTLPGFAAHMDTLYGTLAVRVESRGGRRIVWVTSPNGCEGRFFAEATGERPLKPGLNRFEIIPSGR